MTDRKIYVGFGGTVPGEVVDGLCIWHYTEAYVHPLIDGISDNLWRRIYHETCEAKPMYGKDGSKVFCDYGNYQIVRKLNGKEIRIATITEEA